MDFAMAKTFIIFVIFLISGVLPCRWVCIDENNNIKKRYFDKHKLKVEYSLPVIEVPASQYEVLKRNSNIPEVTLRMPTFEVEPLKASCQTKEFAKTVKEITRKIKCAPRETIVNIVYAGAKVTPNKVSTKLCRGVCSGYKTCISEEKRNVSLAVKTILDTGEVQCATVMVPEDTKCKCGCDIDRSHCLNTQYFDKKLCKCKCFEHDQFDCLSKNKQNIRKKYAWNKETCSCQCIQERVCTTGTVWSKSDCKCILL